MKTLLKVLRFVIYVAIGYAVYYFRLDESIYNIVNDLFQKISLTINKK